MVPEGMNSVQSAMLFQISFSLNSIHVDLNFNQMKDMAIFYQDL